MIGSERPLSHRHSRLLLNSARVAEQSSGSTTTRWCESRNNVLLYSLPFFWEIYIWGRDSWKKTETPNLQKYETSERSRKKGTMKSSTNETHDEFLNEYSLSCRHKGCPGPRRQQNISYTTDMPSTSYGGSQFYSNDFMRSSEGTSSHMLHDVSFTIWRKNTIIEHTATTWNLL